MSTQLKALMNILQIFKNLTPAEMTDLTPLISALVQMIRTGRPLPLGYNVLRQLGGVYSSDKFVPLDQASFQALVDRGTVVIEDPRDLIGDIKFPNGDYRMSIWKNITSVRLKAPDFPKLAGASALVAYLLKQSKHPLRMDVVHGWENGCLICAVLNRVKNVVTIKVHPFLSDNEPYMVMRERGGDES